MKLHRPRRRAKKAGLESGSLVHLGERRLERMRISILDYDAEGVREIPDATAGDAERFRDAPSVTWIDVEGVHDAAALEELGKIFKLHPLVMEDILTTDQRPKMEDYGDYLAIFLRMFCSDDERREIVTDQVGIILGRGFVLSFQEGQLDVFDPIRRSLRERKGRLGQMGADYLAYALVDAIVDSTFGIFESFGDEIDRLEDELIERPKPTTLQKIYRLKRNMLFLRKSVWPLRELISGLERGTSALVGDGVRTYLRDVHDHAIYLVDTVETYRDMLAGMLDIYLSSVSNRMNEVMKILTIIATIFMPLTFLTGLYGMNFQHMPELEWRWGYPVVLAVMASVAGLMVLLFRRRKWI